jgi:hypothetical protein
MKGEQYLKNYYFFGGFFDEPCGWAKTCFKKVLQSKLSKVRTFNLPSLKQ